MSENTITMAACETTVKLVEEQPTTDSAENVTDSLRMEDKIIENDPSSLDAKDNPYAYLDRDDFTSEKFKIEIRGLPKYYGMGELKKLLNEKMNLESNKLKPPRRGSPWIYVCFRSEEDRLSALKSINGFTWKNSVLSATVAQPAQDPLIKKRKLMECEEEGEDSSKQSKVDTRSQEELLKSSVTPFWDVPYEEQARRKEEVIRQMLVKLGKDLVRENPALKPWITEQRAKYDGMPCEVWNVRKSPIVDGYRNKCEFTVGMDDETGKRTVGFRLGSYVHGFLGVGPIDALAHVPQRMKDAVRGFEVMLRASEYDVYNPETQGGHWRQLTARVSFATDQLMLVVGVHPQSLTKEQLDKMKEGLKEFFSEGEGKSCNVSSLYFETMVKKQSGGELPPLEHLLGETHIHENLCGLKFRISPEAFFQVNTPAAEILYDTAFEISSPSPDTTVIDICCGTGTIGLCLAKRCGQVLGLELQKQAVEDAKANAANNGITNSDFFAGKAEEILSSVMNRATQKNILAIVDPPRAGLHRKAVVMLRRTTKLNKLVFLSCDPRAALQNFIDLGRPTSKMYHGIPLIPIRAVPVDLFPHTKHCELIVYFERFGQQAETQLSIEKPLSSTLDTQSSLDEPLPERVMMTENEPEDEVRHSLDVIHQIQSMIDISARRLEGFRTQCATSVELTQQEIRTLEGKLIKLYSRQLVNKAKLHEDVIVSELKHIPSLKQWLQVVGLNPDSIRGVCLKVGSLEALQDKTEHELRSILIERNAREEEIRRLIRALHNLKNYTEILLRGDETNELTLYWDSWDRHQVLKGAGLGSTSPRPTRPRMPSVPCEETHSYSSNSTLAMASSTSSITSLSHSSTPTHYLSNNQAPLSPSAFPTHHSHSTPPSTPPVVKGKVGERVKFPTTPPPKKKHQTGLQNAVLMPDVLPIPKSKSHESQLVNRVEGENQSEGSAPRGRRGRLPTEPGPNSGSEYGHSTPLLPSPIKSPPYAPIGDLLETLQIPKSPRTPTISRGPCHVIAHRFTKMFKVITTCDFCDKQMFIGTGLKCKECKYKCHRDCESKVPPSCGLSRELVEEVRNSSLLGHQSPDGYLPSQSPSLSRPSLSSPGHNPFGWSKRPTGQPVVAPAFKPGPDSSSNTSSCNSSTPSSPAPATATPLALAKPQFQFPDVPAVTLETRPLTVKAFAEEMAGTDKSNDSDKTVSGSGSVSTDSERTPVRVDSQDSQVSDGEAVERAWPRQNSLSMREWDIPWDELKIGEPIGTGRFGTVYRGNWHGDVAIKLLNMDDLDDDKVLEAFKLEVATFRKTRHENLVLFMGACMKPPRLAIVTSMCKGYTLYSHIHLRKDKFTMNKTTSVAHQVAQGMGYLHARGIVHKDLKSKNIFVENGKVVITDFGLFSVTKLCFGNRTGNGLIIPAGWLCYLSPEIIRSLRAQQNSNEEEFPFSKASDVYAFGTVWYELLCGEWTFKAQPPEAIIWQVGKGMKQSLANLQASRDVKDILMLCWSFRPGDRPDFPFLLNTLDKFPKKRLARSPSHPIHLSRSVESVF